MSRPAVKILRRNQRGAGSNGSAGRCRAFLRRAEILPRLLVAEIDERPEDEAGSGQDQCRADVAHHEVVGREVHRRGNDAKRDGLGKRPADGEPAQAARLGVRLPRAGRERREIDGIVVRTEIIPGRFVGEIEQRAGDQVEGRQTRGRGEFADHDVVGGEIQSGDDDPEGDGLGDRLPDGEFGKDVLRRAAAAASGERLPGRLAVGRSFPPASRRAGAGSAERLSADSAAPARRPRQSGCRGSRPSQARRRPPAPSARPSRMFSWACLKLPATQKRGEPHSAKCRMMMTAVRSCRPRSKYSEPPGMNWLRVARSAAAAAAPARRLRALGRDVNRRPAERISPRENGKLSRSGHGA